MNGKGEVNNIIEVEKMHSNKKVTAEPHISDDESVKDDDDADSIKCNFSWKRFQEVLNESDHDDEDDE